MSIRVAPHTSRLSVDILHRLFGLYGRVNALSGLWSDVSDRRRHDFGVQAKSDFAGY